MFLTRKNLLHSLSPISLKRRSIQIWVTMLLKLLTYMATWFLFSGSIILREEIKYREWSIRSIFLMYYIRALKEEDSRSPIVRSLHSLTVVNLTWLLTRLCVLTDFEISQAMTQCGYNNCYTSAIEPILMSEIIFNTHIFRFCPLLYKLNHLASIIYRSNDFVARLQRLLFNTLQNYS